jgi:antitoxin VapB
MYHGTKEVDVDRDPRTREVVLSRRPERWGEIFEALDKTGVPDDFLTDRDQSLPQERPEL